LIFVLFIAFLPDDRLQAHLTAPSIVYSLRVLPGLPGTLGIPPTPFSIDVPRSRFSPDAQILPRLIRVLNDPILSVRFSESHCDARWRSDIPCEILERGFSPACMSRCIYSFQNAQLKIPLFKIRTTSLRI
jgi:hypothetical protein